MTTDFIDNTPEEPVEATVVVAPKEDMSPEETLRFTQRLRLQFIDGFDMAKLADQKPSQQRLVLETLNAMDTAALDKLKIDTQAGMGEAVQQANNLIAGMMMKLNEGVKPLEAQVPVERVVTADNVVYELELVPGELDMQRSDLTADKFIREHELKHGINRGD